MNSKAIKRQLLAAIAMVLVAALALGSSTYAWFVASGSVTAKDMKVNVTVNMGGVTVNESKGDIDSLTKQIVQNICYEMQKQAVNMNVGAI